MGQMMSNFPAQPTPLSGQKGMLMTSSYCKYYPFYTPSLKIPTQFSTFLTMTIDGANKGSRNDALFQYEGEDGAIG